MSPFDPNNPPLSPMNDAAFVDNVATAVDAKREGRQIQAEIGKILQEVGGPHVDYIASRVDPHQYMRQAAIEGRYNTDLTPDRFFADYRAHVQQEVQRLHDTVRPDLAMNPGYEHVMDYIAERRKQSQRQKGYRD